jgi:hypothetical protein
MIHAAGMVTPHPDRTENFGQCFLFTEGAGNKKLLASSNSCLMWTKFIV